MQMEMRTLPIRAEIRAPHRLPSKCSLALVFSVGVLDELDEYLVTGEFPVYFRCCVIHCCSLVFLGGHARALLTFVLATDWDPVDAE